MPFSGDDDHQTLVKVAKADWDFDDECFDDLSHDAMEFIEGLLVKDPRHVLMTMSCPNSGILTYEFSTLTKHVQCVLPFFLLLVIGNRKDSQHWFCFCFLFSKFLSEAICFLMMHIGTY